MLKAILGLLKNELRRLGFSRDLVTEAGSFVFSFRAEIDLCKSCPQ